MKTWGERIVDSGAMLLAGVALTMIAVSLKTPAAPAAPVPAAPPVVICVLDSNQIARFATYFSPASE
jgi:hypothetical protein